MDLRLASVSVDLDEVPCYCAIHGLPPPPPEARWAIYERALPRFVELFDELRLRATFFVVGHDLEQGPAADAVRALHAAGHEIGNHSHDHYYDFSRRSKAVIHAQIELANQAIEDVVGQRPSGFRAPGYTVNDAAFAALADAGMAYDSSVFPCPMYYAAKATAVGAIRALGRRSHSVLDTPQVLLAPADPYHAGAPYFRRGRGLLELPIGVTRDATGRLPYIGSSLVMAGATGARLLTQAVSGRPLVNLELHGMDLADADRDGLQFLRAHQPDLRRGLVAKLSALRTAIESLSEADYELVTLAQAAHAFSQRR